MYDFKQLSPADFEELTRDLLQKLWAVRLESFKTGRDQGIDLRYSAAPDHPWTIQCKHYVGSKLAKLVSDLATKELPKVKKLGPKRYVLVTSLPLNPPDKEKLRAAVSPYIRTPDDVFGAEDLNNLLRMYPAIEHQHYKLWFSSTDVLQRVLHNAEKVQTDFDIERIQRMIPKYVQTSSYLRATKILDEHRFVIISGVPGIGKTTLANMLLYAHLDASFEPVVIQSSIEEGKKLFKKEAHQIFYFDDFLGDTFLGNRLFDFLGKKEDLKILDFMELVALSKHSRLIVTTREHILRHAFEISERFRHHVGLDAHRCVLEIGGYTLLDRGRILYNHIYFSDLPEPFRLELLKDEFYLGILRHPNFNPRLVEWLSTYTNIKDLPAEQYQEKVLWILDNPEELWRGAFEQQISDASRSMLLALYSLGGKAHLDQLETVWQGLNRYRASKYNWQTNAEDWRRSLQELDGGFLNFKDRHAEFVNPSVKDFLEATLTQNADHFDDVLASATRFEQIVVLWNLATSEGGEPLQARLTKAPSHLLSAMAQNIETPHEERIPLGSGSTGYAIRRLDVPPEVKLRTLISVADRTQSDEAMKVARGYLESVLSLWAKHRPRFGHAMELLAVIDASKWPAIADAKIYFVIKTALLQKLEDWPNASDISSMADYASGKPAGWAAEDQEILTDIAKEYLDNSFWDELADCGDVNELESLYGDVDTLGSCCGLAVREQQDHISDRIGTVAAPDPDDDRPVRPWRSGDAATGVNPDAEVKRIFDGLC